MNKAVANKHFTTSFLIVRFSIYLRICIPISLVLSPRFSIRPIAKDKQLENNILKSIR